MTDFVRRQPNLNSLSRVEVSVDVSDPVLSTGIQSGGFFLMRFFTDDVIERIYRPLHAFCRQHAIRTDEQLRAGATTFVRRLLAFADKTLGMNVFDMPGGLVPELHRLSAHGFARFPGARFNSEYDRVSFGSREQLMTLIKRYLDDAPERRRLAGAMRRKWIERIGDTDGPGAEAKQVPDVRAAGEVAA